MASFLLLLIPHPSNSLIHLLSITLTLPYYFLFLLFLFASIIFLSPFPIVLINCFYLLISSEILIVTETPNNRNLTFQKSIYIKMNLPDI